MTATSNPALDGWAVVVLAAGRGTRMRSRLPKVLHPVCGRPMLQLVLDNVSTAGFSTVAVVASDAAGPVAASVNGNAVIAVQPEPLGTGDATLAAREAAAGHAKVLILNADQPLIAARTLREAAERHEQSPALITFLTAYLDDPTGYGRVIRRDGRVAGIVEDRDTDEATRRVHEVNAGLYAADADWLWPALERIAVGPQGERYLTDLIALAVEREGGAAAHQVRESSEAQQVNTRAELARVEVELRERVRRRLMEEGVTLVDPASTYVDVGVRVAPDTTLMPGVHLLGETVVGGSCEIGPNAILRNMTVGDHCTIGGSTLEDSTLEDGVTIGPYCHVRAASRIARDAYLGNYAEVKFSSLGARTKVGHFSFIGDAEVGADVNFGAGAVTCNFDGVEKHGTRIGDGAFVGSDSMLVAPLVLGAGARTAAGSVVTEDVAPGTTVMGVPARVRIDSDRGNSGGEREE